MLASLERKGLMWLAEWKAARLAKKEKALRDRKNYEYTERIAQAKHALDLVRENFDFVTDEAVKEYYIYMIKAEETKLNSRFEKLRNEGAYAAVSAGKVLLPGEEMEKTGAEWINA